MIPFVYLNANPGKSASLFGDQMFLHTLVEGKVEFFESLEGLDGAIVSIRGVDNIDYISQINALLAPLKWCIVIINGNENSTNFYKRIIHPNIRRWIQTPKLSDEADYFLPIGYPSRVEPVNRNNGRPFDFIFAGQTNTKERIDCVANLEQMKKGIILTTGGFGQGFTNPTYLELLENSKIACCPSAIATPDSFRLYEALELGCIPVLDHKDYYLKVLGVNPLFFLENWSEFPYINAVIQNEYKKYQLEVQDWWQGFKRKIANDLLSQVKEISQ